MSPSTTPEPDSELEKILISYKFDYMNGTKRGHSGLTLADALTALKARDERLKLEARVATANWAVHFVDKIEQEKPAPDDMWRTFKFIRNGMRDEFERVYGVDPSPRHDPASAQLKAEKEDKQ